MLGVVSGLRACGHCVGFLCGDRGTLEEASMWNKMKNDELSKLSLFGCSENCVCMKRLQQKIY